MADATCEDINRVGYRWAIGTEIAFATEKGVKRGVVVGVHIQIVQDGNYTKPRPGPVGVMYEVRVKNGSSPATHTETVPEPNTALSLDDAWRIFERF